MWLTFAIICRILGGGILLLGGFAKMSSVPTWQQVWLASYRLLPRPLVRPVARGLPYAEVGCGLAMLAGVLGAASAGAAAALLAVITAAVITALVRHLEIACGCLGRLGELVSWRIVGRNVLLIVASIAVALRGGADVTARLNWAVQVVALVAAVAAVSGAAQLGHLRRRRALLAAIAARPVPRPATISDPALD